MTHHRKQQPKRGRHTNRTSGKRPSAKSAAIQQKAAGEAAGPITPAQALQLQRQVGNRATIRLLQQNGAVQMKREAAVQPVNQKERQAAIAYFEQKYEHAIDSTPLEMDIGPTLLAFDKATHDHNLENYTSQIFTPKFYFLLEALNKQVDGKDPDNADEIGLTLANMLLFSSLVPSQITAVKSRFSKTKYLRQAAETISPTQVLQKMIAMIQQLTLDNDALDNEAMGGVELSDKDSIEQRMLKISLLNPVRSAREALQDDPVFQKIMGHSDIVSVIMASKGAIEQDFLNTCSAAAVNQGIQSKVSTIIGLLQVGRGLTDYVEEQTQSDDEKMQEALQKRARWRFKKATVRDLAQERVKLARLGFDNIELRATWALRENPVDMVALQQLTQEWSRIMQKLSAVVELSKGTKEVPVLSKKALREKWLASAALSTIAGVGFSHPQRRARGINDKKYKAAISGQVGVNAMTSDMSINHYLDKAKKKEGRIELVKALWTRVVEAGGTVFNSSSHALYMKALMQGDAMLFAVGDPMINKYAFKTIPEMEKFLSSKKWSMSGDVLYGLSSPVAYLTKSEVKVYDKPEDADQQKKTPKMYKLTMKDVILTYDDDAQVEVGKDGQKRTVTLLKMQAFRPKEQDIIDIIEGYQKPNKIDGIESLV